MSGIYNVSLMPPMLGKPVPSEPTGALAPQSDKSLLDGVSLQRQLEGQVSSAYAHTSQVLRESLALLGFTESELATALGQLDEKQLRQLRELGTFGPADFSRLVGRLGDEELERLSDIDGLSDTELAMLTSEVSRQVGVQTPESSGFDPRVMEQQTGVLLAAIIAFNLARVSNAQLRGHFSVISANAALEQGKAIREQGNASLYSSLGAAVVSGAFSAGGLALSLKSFQAKNADLSTNGADAMKARQLQAELREELHDPNKLAALTPENQRIYRDSLEALISDAGLRMDTAEWMSKLALRQPERLAAIGGSVSSMSSVISNSVSASIQMEGTAQKEREVVQQSNQNVQKSLADEQGQVDARDAELLRKLMEIFQQISASRNSVIEAMVRA